MSLFSVPADFSIETVRTYETMNQMYDDKVNETYGQMNDPGNKFGSGRSADHLPYCDLPMLEKYVDYSKAKGIGFNYILNTTCLSNEEFTVNGLTEILEFLKKLAGIGVESVTVCLPSLIELIVTSGLPLKIKGSTICGIINADKAKSFKTLGVHRIVVDESINRDFATLRRINEVYPGEVEMIVNVICYKNCIYRPFHHNQMSHDSAFNQKSVSYYSHRCMMKRGEATENLLKMCFVRPEDLWYYEEIPITRYKIQGRQAAVKGNLQKTVEAYMKRMYDGNLLDLLDCFAPTNSFRYALDNRKLDTFLEPFYRANICNNHCEACNYCKVYMESHFDVNEVGFINKMSREYYNAMDEFKNNIREAMGNTTDG